MKYLIKRQINDKNFLAYIEWDPETQLYVGIIPGVPGAHNQGATLDELNQNLKEVLELCLEVYEGNQGKSESIETLISSQIPNKTAFSI